MKIENMISIIILFGIISCSKPEIIPPIIDKPNCSFGLCDTSKLEIVWQKPLSYDTSERFSAYPLLHENSILFSRSTFGEQWDTLKSFDQKTGQLKWTWADYFSNGELRTYKIYLEKGKYIFNAGNDIFVVDATNGKTLWKTKLLRGGSSASINIQYDHIYMQHLDESSTKNLASYLVRSNISYGKWDTLFTENRRENSIPIGMQSPTIWISPQKDTIALFQIRFVDYGDPLKSKVDFVAYNITQKNEYFRYDNIDKLRGGSTKLPFLIGNLVYVAFTKSIYCFDLIEKKIKWSKDMSPGENFSSGQPFIFVENQFFVKPTNRSLYQIDPNTGAEIWSDKDNGSGNSDMVYDNGILYYTGDGVGKIFALEVATKKWLWAEPSPNKFPNAFNGNRRFGNANIGSGGIAIDAKNGYLYTSDFYFAMCLKLPKR